MELKIKKQCSTMLIQDWDSFINQSNRISQTVLTVEKNDKLKNVCTFVNKIIYTTLNSEKQ
jgi:hypothetical protein